MAPEYKKHPVYKELSLNCPCFRYWLRNISYVQAYPVSESRHTERCMRVMTRKKKKKAYPAVSIYIPDSPPNAPTKEGLHPPREITPITMGPSGTLRRRPIGSTRSRVESEDEV